MILPLLSVAHSGSGIHSTNLGESSASSSAIKPQNPCFGSFPSLRERYHTGRAFNKTSASESHKSSISFLYLSDEVLRRSSLAGEDPELIFAFAVKEPAVNLGKN